MDTARTSVTWMQACPIGELSPGEATTLDIEPPIAVFNVDGVFYAIDDTCTHETYSLADGYLEGAAVECALHYAKFDLRTGEALSLPAFIGVRTYPVKTEDGHVYVDVSSRD